MLTKQRLLKELPRWREQEVRKPRGTAPPAMAPVSVLMVVGLVSCQVVSWLVILTQGPSRWRMHGSTKIDSVRRMLGGWWDRWAGVSF